MPRRATGNARESTLADNLDLLGYCVVPIKGSGARGAKMRRRLHPFAGDILAIPANREAPLPWLQIECGKKDSPRKAFAELERCILPGFKPLVVAYQYRRGAKVAKRYYYHSPLDCVESLSEAIAALSPQPRYSAWASPA